MFHVPGGGDELADALSRSPMTELDEEQEVEENHRLRKVHADSTRLPIALIATENHQNDSDQDWKDATIEKRGDAKLRALDAGKIIIPSTLKNDLMDWHHENLKHPGGDQIYLTLKTISVGRA